MEGPEGEGHIVLEHSILPREVLQPLGPRALLCVRQLWSRLKGEMNSKSPNSTLQKAHFYLPLQNL